MVIDCIENAERYYGLGKRFRAALEWLAVANPDELISGERVEIDGDFVYATMFQVDTLPPDDCKLEAHRDYADIQYIAKGTEALGYVLDGPALPRGDYQPDIQLFQAPWDAITIRPGTFYIVWPQDLHAPRVAIGTPAPVTRLVVKVKL